MISWLDMSQEYSVGDFIGNWIYVRNFEGREWEEHEDKLRGKSKCKGGTEKSSAKNANDEDKNCIE